MSIFNSIRFLALTSLLLFFAAVILADTHYVRPPETCTNTTDQSPYTSWDTAATNIQWSLNAAETNDTVLVTNGVYTTVAPTYWALDIETNSSVVCISNPMTLRSMNGPSNTVIDGNSANGNSAITSRCVFVSKGATLDGFTVRNGYASNAFCLRRGDASGGGVYIYPYTNYGPPYGGTVTNCLICSNYAQSYGGGISAGGPYTGDVVNCTMVVANCVIFTNYTYRGHGGGMYAGGGSSDSTGRVYILNCSIISNNATAGPDWVGGNGGGIYNNPSKSYVRTIISNCTFSFNRSVSAYGHAMHIGRADVIDCGISNHNNIGAGWFVIYLYGGTMKNCSILNNINNAYVALLLGSSSATNCVVANNGKGGGAAFSGSSANQCIFSNNLNNTGSQWLEGPEHYVAGGIIAFNNSLLRNCLICNNTNTYATGVAGGVYVTNAAADRSQAGLINCTIVNNWSTNTVGGICTRGTNNYIVNCVIANNTAPSNSDVYFYDAVNTNNFYYCSVNTNLAPNQGNITNDPVFAGAGAGNWRLANNSPCMNTGTNQNWMTNSFDLDGRARIRYGTVDMGAYEKINEATVYNFR